MLEQVKIEKLVHGGQGLASLSSGQKIFIWNALPGELVGVRVGRKKKGFAEGFAEEIVEPSKDRIEPIDEAYLSTSPWQIMSFEAENRFKKEILHETFDREKVSLPNFEFISEGSELYYRNKMEYSFWADEEGLHLALFHRASHGKRIVWGSSIAHPEIDKTANNIVAILNKNGIRGSQLKTLVLRVNKQGNTVAALFVKDEKFKKITELETVCQGITICYSNPKSPASVITKELFSYGSIVLNDEILGNNICYDVHSFFQVNLPVFEVALQKIKTAVEGQSKIVDMYAGVGTIGLSVGVQKLVELDEHNVDMAKQNGNVEVVHASTENAIEHIVDDTCIIFDPPRAGLHEKVIERILEAKPPKIIYLSCNPSTQARDINRLSDAYKISEFVGYNFFPRTPHIESLCILERI